MREERLGKGVQENERRGKREVGGREGGGEIQPERTERVNRPLGQPCGAWSDGRGQVRV